MSVMTQVNESAAPTSNDADGFDHGPVIRRREVNGPATRPPHVSQGRAPDVNESAPSVPSAGSHKVAGGSLYSFRVTLPRITAPRARRMSAPASGVDRVHGVVGVSIGSPIRAGTPVSISTSSTVTVRSASRAPSVVGRMGAGIDGGRGWKR